MRALLCGLMLGGCGTLGPTAEQMKAMEGLNSSLCVKSPGWNGAAVEVHYTSFGGKAVGTAGGGGKVACGTSTVEFNNEGRAQAAPKLEEKK